MRPLKSPFYKECNLETHGSRINDGRKLADETKRWMESHEQAFWQMMRYVKTLQREGIKGRLRDRVSTYCVDNNINTSNSQYRFANELWAGISRYMVLIDPSLKYNPIEANTSCIDLFGLYPISYLELEA